MHNKINNEKEAKQQFEKRLQETKEKAMEENKKIATENNNVLTQVLNDDGNLVNVREVDYDAIPDEMAITESSDAENKKRFDALNLKNELFEKANLELNSNK